MDQHGLERAREAHYRNVPAGNPSVVYAKHRFASCEWPPPSCADEDGYTEITVSVEEGLDLLFYRTIWRIHPTCQVVELKYTFARQGNVHRLRPYQVEVSDVTSVTGEPWKRSIEFPGGYPARDEIVTVGEGFQLDDARCVEAEANAG